MLLSIVSRPLLNLYTDPERFPLLRATRTPPLLQIIPVSSFPIFFSLVLVYLLYFLFLSHRLPVDLSPCSLSPMFARSEMLDRDPPRCRSSTRVIREGAQVRNYYPLKSTEAGRSITATNRNEDTGATPLGGGFFG